MSLGLTNLADVRTFTPKSTTCVKCPEPGVAVLNRKDVYCRNCFLHFVSHRFRSTLGKQRIFRASDKVVLAISGGASSSAMLDLICEAMRNDQKKLKLEPSILHLVETSGDFEECQAFLKNVKDRTGYPVYVAHLSTLFAQAFEVQPYLDNVQPSKVENDEKLKCLLNGFTSQTAKLDFYKRLKTFCLVYAARTLGFRYLMLGSGCSALSSEILADVAQGRGAQIKDQVSVLDKRWTEVAIVRPLRELQDKELALYNHFRIVPTHIHAKDVHVGFGGGSSIQSETDDFVTGLQDQFPSTVCTLFSTASKLASLNKNEGNKCKLCSSSVDDEEESLSEVKKFCFGCSLTLSELESEKFLPMCLQQ